MSVIHFADDELGNVAAALAGRWGRREMIKLLCSQLALVSKANAATYTARYNETAEAFTAAQIESVVPGCIEYSRPQALATVRSIGGNVDTRRCTKAQLVALAEIQHRALDAALD